jgi:hypothetical protein
LTCRDSPVESASGELDVSEQIRAALARVASGEDPEVAFAGVPVNWRKWMDDLDGAIVLVKNGHALTDADVAEARSRIAAGEDSMSVWADIDARMAARLLMRQDAED